MRTTSGCPASHGFRLRGFPVVLRFRRFPFPHRQDRELNHDPVAAAAALHDPAEIEAALPDPPSLPPADDGIEGVQDAGSPWGDYPLDDLLIRQESRTVFEVVRRISSGQYVMDPDFQRDFIWKKDKQSKLIESVILRIPLPVFYLAEDEEGRVVVVDGLQRLSTFYDFLNDKLTLDSLEREELNGKRFSDLPYKLQNRIEDCNLILYTIDSRVPDRAKLDIFDRVNSGVPLSRQQMRNCLFMGNGTRFLKEEAKSDIFLKATGGSLSSDMMRDREFVNRFSAFYLLPLYDYRGDMDDFLATALLRMNEMETHQLTELSNVFRRSLTNNYVVFGPHAFRRFWADQERRSVVNASLWDVMSTGLGRYSENHIAERQDSLHLAVQNLLEDEDFVTSITYGTNDTKRVIHRFQATRMMFKAVLG